MIVDEYIQKIQRPGDHTMVGVSPKELQKLLNEREDLLTAIREIRDICDGSPMTKQGRLNLIKNIAIYHAQEGDK